MALAVAFFGLPRKHHPVAAASRTAVTARHDSVAVYAPVRASPATIAVAGFFMPANTSAEASIPLASAWARYREMAMAVWRLPAVATAIREPNS